MKIVVCACYAFTVITMFAIPAFFKYIASFMILQKPKCGRIVPNSSYLCEPIMVIDASVFNEKVSPGACQPRLKRGIMSLK